MEFLEFLPHLLGAEALGSGCSSFELNDRGELQAGRCPWPGQHHGTEQHQIFQQLSLSGSTKLRRSSVGAAQKDAASSSFKHGITEGCNCARPCGQTLCLGLTKLEQVTQKAVIYPVVVVVGGGKRQVRTQQDLLLAWLSESIIPTTRKVSCCFGKQVSSCLTLEISNPLGKNAALNPLPAARGDELRVEVGGWELPGNGKVLCSLPLCGLEVSGMIWDKADSSNWVFPLFSEYVSHGQTWGTRISLELMGLVCCRSCAVPRKGSSRCSLGLGN